MKNSALPCLLFVLAGTTVLAAEPKRSVQALSACGGNATPIMNGWNTVERSESEVAFSIPPSLKEVHDPKVWCVHGCEQWVRGSFTVSLSYGMWGPESFADKDWSTACVASQGDLTLVQMSHHAASEHSVLVWVVQEGSTISTNGALIAVKWSSSTDTDEAYGVISTIRGIKKSKPAG